MDFHDLYDNEFQERQALFESHAASRTWLHVRLARRGRTWLGLRRKPVTLSILPIGVEVGNVGPISNLPLLMFILACGDGKAVLKWLPVNSFDDDGVAIPPDEIPDLDYSELLNEDVVTRVIDRLRKEGVVRSDDRSG